MCLLAYLYHIKHPYNRVVQEAIGGSRVDQRLHRNRRLTRYEEVHLEGIERDGEGDGVRMLDVKEIGKQTQSTRWEMVVLGVVKYMSC